MNRITKTSIGIVICMMIGAVGIAAVTLALSMACVYTSLFDGWSSMSITLLWLGLDIFMVSAPFGNWIYKLTGKEEQK